MKRKNRGNYLDYVPVCAPAVIWNMDHKGMIEIKIENKGFYNWLAQKLFQRPRFSTISLDEFGSFVWRQMDGSCTIYDIARLLKEKYGAQAEPLYERCTGYFQILYRNHFIAYAKGR